MTTDRMAGNGEIWLFGRWLGQMAQPPYSTPRPEIVGLLDVVTPTGSLSRLAVAGLGTLWNSPPTFNVTEDGH